MTTTPQQPDRSPSYEQLDPATLLVDRNLREVRADEAFRRLVGSVRDLGVLQPVTVHRTADGDRVLFGHRRTLAAVDAGLTTLPALVHTGDTVAAFAHGLTHLVLPMLSVRAGSATLCDPLWTAKGSSATTSATTAVHSCLWSARGCVPCTGDLCKSTVHR